MNEIMMTCECVHGVKGGSTAGCEKCIEELDAERYEAQFEAGEIDEDCDGF